VKHKWKKRKFRKLWYEDGTERAHLAQVKIYGTKECTFCGLRKGYFKEYAHPAGVGFFPTLVYFDPDRVLSQDKLPFSCNGEWIGGDLPIDKSKEVFILEEEFLVI
jgi:hypothetical protein